MAFETLVKLEKIATTTEIKEVDVLLSQGWELFNTASFPAQSNVGMPAIITLYILIKK